MKKTLLFAALAAFFFAACNSSVSDEQMSKDVHLLVSKTEQCFANVHNDLIDSLDVEFFQTCNDELDQMMMEIDGKYSNKEDRRKFDSLFMSEIQKSDLDNDLISLMMEIYEMDFEDD